jgi:hypothetical protein
MYTFQLRNCGSKWPCAASSSSSSGKGLRTSSPPSGITAAYYFRKKESALFYRFMQTGAPEGMDEPHYHEYIGAPDAGYVDLYGHVLQYTPDWACRIDGTLCTLELVRTSHREELYGALRHGNAKLYRRIRR